MKVVRKGDLGGGDTSRQGEESPGPAGGRQSHDLALASNSTMMDGAGGLGGASQGNLGRRLATEDSPILLPLEVPPESEADVGIFDFAEDLQGGSMLSTGATIGTMSRHPPMAPLPTSMAALTLNAAAVVEMPHPAQAH